MRAGELLDVDNILTSPDLLQAVGLSARRQDIIILPQTRKDGKNEYTKFFRILGAPALANES